MGPTPLRISQDQDSPAVIRFGVFEADLRSAELRKNGVKIKIQDLPFRALRVLLERPGEVVGRDDLRQALWPADVFVDFDHAISSAIKRVRDALGDSASNPIFIETVERRGYRWIAPMHSRELTAAPKQEATTVVEMPRSPALRWRWILVLPALALAFSAWTFRPGYRSARANIRVPLSSTSDADFSYRPADREAEDFYLKGRFYWNKRTPESLNQALDAFTQAIVHDPNYAQAYVGLADCYNLLREYTVMPASEAYPRALAAAKKAVELDDQSSQAHASLAFATFYGAWDAATADREFRRAIQLNPANATAHHWYGTYLLTLGRFGESLSEIERAQALDPSSKSILADKGAILAAMGRKSEGLRLLQQMEATEPDFISPHRYLKSVYFEMGDYSNYLAEMKKEAALTHDNSAMSVATVAEKGFAAGGAQAMLEAIRREQKRLYAQGKFSPYPLAETCALLGNRAETLEYLKVAYARRSEGVAQMGTDSSFNFVHADPGFQELVAKVGLPQ